MEGEEDTDANVVNDDSMIALVMMNRGLRCLLQPKTLYFLALYPAAGCAPSAQSGFTALL